MPNIFLKLKSGGIVDHSELCELDYASSGHTGFASSDDLTTVSGNLSAEIDSDVSTLSGTLSAEIDSDIVTFSGTIDHDTILNTHNLTTDIDHDQLTNYAVGQHREINDSASGATDLWSAEKITAEVAAAEGTTTFSGLTDTPSAYDDGKYLRSTVSGTEWATVSGAGGLSDIIEDTTPQLGGDLDTNQKNIELQSVPTDNQEANGIIATMTVDANATGFGAALHMDTDEHWIEADANSADTMPCQALALEAGTGSKKVLLRGFIRDDSWDWTVGDTIYVSTTSGTLTQTTVSGSGDQVQAVGYATHADRMFFDPTPVIAEVGVLLLTESNIIDLDKYTQAEVDNLITTLSGNLGDDITTLSGALQNNIDAKSDIGHAHTSSNITDWQEAVDDSVNTLLIGGDNITLTYDDGANTLTISGSAGGEIDHGALTGLGDDDHTQYIPTDGSRGFTATVSGIDPTEDYHLTTKGYVDDEIATISGTYLLRDGTRTLTDDWEIGEYGIELTPSISNDHRVSGNITSMQVDFNSIGFGCALYMATDGNFEEACATSTATMPCTALATESGTGEKKVLLTGFTRDDSWDWTPGGNLFVSTTSGTLTQTTVSGSGDQAQVVGYATHADRIYFNPNIMLIEIE